MRRSVLAGLAVMAMALAISVDANSRTSLVGQGYTDIVVGISPLLDESQADHIITAIKMAMNESSHVLFRATGNRLFFRKVKILVPNTWKTVTIDQAATNEVFEESHIRVDKMNPVYQEQVYTLQPGKCREPGRYIHVTPEYLTNKNSPHIWGPTGKVLTQAFARLRWGVFDEIGYPNDPRFPLFYRGYDENYRSVAKPNYCTDKELHRTYFDVTTLGRCEYNDDMPDENCRFHPDPQGMSISSLMSLTTVDNVQDFCDDNFPGDVKGHIPDAPNKQNDMCNRHSVWDIMLAHDDFKNAVKLSSNTPVSPEVVVVQQTSASFALVLDYSTSMTGNKISVMVNGVKRWLLHDVADGSFVTIIKFSDTAQVAKSLVQISSSTRQSLANSITTNPSGYTCIGCGLNKALEELKTQSNKVIVLLTDGEENRDPKIANVLDTVANSGARVITVSYGKSAEKTLETLAQQTGGKAYIVPDDDDGSFMNDAFQSSLTYQPSQSIINTNIKIHEWNGTAEGNKAEIGGTFIVDFTVGRNLEFRLDTTYNVPGSPYLTSPSGEKFTNAKFESDINLWIINLGDKIAEVGTWKWAKPTGGETSYVKVVVTAQARDQNTLPIITESWMNTETNFVDASKQQVVVYARVRQGDSPVVGAKVRAYITTPVTTAAAIELDLLDNGQGADVQAGDGVYSRYFTQFNGNGRYAVKAQVWDDRSTFINNGFITSKRRRRRAVNGRFPRATPIDDVDLSMIPDYCCGSFVPFDPETAVPTGNFVRNVAAGSFNVVQMPPSSDSFPPDKVADVTISINNSTSITLTWTAPGDDYDAGVVFGYDIWMSTNKSALGNDVDVDNAEQLLDVASSSNMTELLVEGGEKVNLTLILEEPLKTKTVYYLALRAVDEAGNEGEMSRPVDFVYTVVASGSVSISSGLSLCTFALLTAACIHSLY